MGLIMQNGISYGGVDIVKLTQAEYDALPESKNSDGILYAITDGENSSGSTSKPVELTKAQYEALGESTKTDGILYAITDGDELSAKNMAYDGSVTGLGNNVQSAIDELNSNIRYHLEKISLDASSEPKAWSLNIFREGYTPISFSITHNNSTDVIVGVEVFGEVISGFVRSFNTTSFHIDAYIHIVYIKNN